MWRGPERRSGEARKHGLSDRYGRCYNATLKKKKNYREGNGSDNVCSNQGSLAPGALTRTELTYIVNKARHIQTHEYHTEKERKGKKKRKKGGGGGGVGGRRVSPPPPLTLSVVPYADTLIYSPQSVN